MRVLVAHYDPEQRDRMTSALQEAGADVLTAADGTDALTVAEQELPTFAVISTLLAGVHGFEVCRQLSAAVAMEEGRSSTPVVLVSDVDDAYIRARARHAGARTLLIEPVAAETLKELVKTDLDGLDPLDLPAGRTPAESRDLLADLLHPEGGVAGQGVVERLSDPLTGLMGREFCALKIEEECKRATRYRCSLSILLADIGNAEALRDEHGESGLEEVILEVAGVFLCESRDVDVAGRLDDTKFVLLMPNTAADGAKVAVDRYATHFQERFAGAAEEGGPVAAMRLGLASMDGTQEEVIADELLAKAEAGLRHAVAGGKSA